MANVSAQLAQYGRNHSEPRSVRPRYCALMVNPITSVAVGAAGEAGKVAGGLLSRWLGPLADEAGEGLARRYRQRNVERSVARGAKKTDLTRPGVVPLRVAAEVFEKAQWSEDEFVAEYLSGVLASARTDEDDNDAGVSWAALIGRMSADQLRLHYVLYAGVRERVLADSLSDLWSWTQLHFYVRLDSLASALGWPVETEAHVYRLYEAAYALAREDCLEHITHGDGSYLREHVTYTKGRDFDANAGHFVFQVTPTGIKLFLNGHGYGKRWYTAIEDPKLEFKDRFDAGGISPAPVAFVNSVPDVSASDTP